MTHTTQQLQAMSDHAINHALYHKLFQAGVNVPDITPSYCNNPNDIMPLAFERGISINFCPHLDAWTASAWKKTGKKESTMINSFRCDTSPLRAIACLLLMMEG